MRVMLTNHEGCYEVVLIDKASITVAGDQIVLTRSDNCTLVFVDVNSHFTAHATMLNLLENGYADLSDYAADYKKL